MSHFPHFTEMKMTQRRKEEAIYSKVHNQEAAEFTLEPMPLEAK